MSAVTQADIQAAQNMTRFVKARIGFKMATPRSPHALALTSPAERHWIPPHAGLLGRARPGFVAGARRPLITQTPARCMSFGARDCKKRQLLQKGPVKVIEIIRISKRSESASRRSLQPFSPIQNNSDLAQGLFQFAPLKSGMTTSIWRQEGTHGTKTRTS